ncbi:MAG: hypothetical protein SV239_02435 [Thermodesulfobacteriota bacterium]|nr:hypothetical protein [Thermodesulfobacteriota bacterium]
MLYQGDERTCILVDRDFFFPFSQRIVNERLGSMNDGLNRCTVCGRAPPA